jgi:hypothetical protein
MAESQPLHLQIDCINPPHLAPDAPVEFGLQDKSGALTPGTSQPDGALRFECDLRVELEGSKPNFLGAFAHGTLQDRFLYLTWKNRADNQIIQRIKIKLASLTAAQVEAALQNDPPKHLHASISATRTGSVPLLGDGWQVSD